MLLFEPALFCWQMFSLAGWVWMKQMVREVQRGAEGIWPAGTPHPQVADLDRKIRNMVWLLWIRSGF